MTPLLASPRWRRRVLATEVAAALRISLTTGVMGGVGHSHVRRADSLYVLLVPSWSIGEY